MSTEDVKPITVKKLPLILNKNIILKKGVKKIFGKIRPLKSLQSSLQEDIIYTSKPGDFTAGEVLKMTIVNQLNVLTQSSRTVAKCHSHNGEIYEKTSEEITKLIGQKNYDILISSLCSIISQELKIRSINSLLTVPKKSRSVTCQTDTVFNSFRKNNWTEMCTQTDESCIEDMKKFKPRRRNKRQQLAPYVVKDTPESQKLRRLVITPDNFEMILIKQETTPKTESQTITLPELGECFDDDSNNSDRSGRFSALSVKTTSDLMLNPMSILTNVDKHTRDISELVKQAASNRYTLHNMDTHSQMSVSDKSMSQGVSQLMPNLPPDQRRRLLFHQGLKDWSTCLTADEDGHLPIHVAVLSSDVDLLRRQCMALTKRGTSVDVPADGLTPLRMSLFQDNTKLTSLLLEFGADPLDSDGDDRSPLHVAAELATDHLPVLLNYCQQNARKLLQENEELWSPVFDSKSHEDLERVLLDHVNQSYDCQGYTPLMLASKLGKYNNVMALVESCRGAVNAKMPNSGNTALFLAVGAACMDAAERGDKTKIVDHFRKTVEILVEHGADPNIENFAGCSVNDLLTEFNIGELSMLIANKLTSVRFFDGRLPTNIKGSDLMLVKDNEGKVNITEVNEKKPTVKNQPVIVENVTYKPAKAAKSIPRQTPGKRLSPGTVKQEKVNVTQTYTPIVENYKLDKPLILKSKMTGNNKRKLEIVIEPNKIKKLNETV